MITAEPAVGPSAADHYAATLVAVARGESVGAVPLYLAASTASVDSARCNQDLAQAGRRVAARQAMDAGAETADRYAELGQQEKALAAAASDAKAAAQERLTAEFEQRLAEAYEAAEEPLRAFRETHSAEQARLSKISRAAAEGRELLIRTADPAIDRQIEALQIAEAGNWGPLAIKRDKSYPIDYAALERREARERQIESLSALKLAPENFEHGASSPWRTFDAGEAAS